VKIEDFALDYDFGVVILASIMFAFTILNPEANKTAVTFRAFACIPFILLRIGK
jgi:ABC-type Na+ efflux pump permease subunit